MTTTQDVKLTHESEALIGQIALPQASGLRPGVLVMSSAMGLGEFTKQRALLLAEQGYVALATDMYGDGAFFTVGADAGDPFTRLLSNPQLTRSRLLAWCDLVKARPDVDAQRIAAIGYCFGGYCVLELARTGADVKAVISYHGLLHTQLPAEQGAIKGEVVVYTGAKDPHVPHEHVEALRKELSEAQAHHQITVFNEALHSFTDPDADALGMPGIGYNALAESVSWAGTLAVLKQVFR